MENQSSKKIISDILPRKKSIVQTGKEKDFFEKLSDARKNKVPEKKETGKKKKNKGIYILSGIFVFFIMVGLYLIKPASGAVIKIKPVSKSVSVNVFLKASSEGGEIVFRLLNKELEKEEKIIASGFEKSEKKSSGAIVIYNTFSQASQTLIKSTRFEAPDGKIYRIDKTISVPGAKISGNKTISGSVEAVVYADAPGEKYNLEFSDFSIPGFKGTAKYSKIYARTKTPITGGFAGNVPKVNAADLEKATSKLKAEIEKEIFEDAEDEVNKNEILFKDGTDISFESKQIMPENSNDAAILKEKGKFTGAVFNKDDITLYLINKYLKNTEFKDDSYIKNFEDLNFKITKKDFSNSQIILKIEGDARFVKKINKEKLKEELINTRNKEEVFKFHTEIDEAKIIFNPPWKKKLPQNSSKLEIQIEE